MTESTSIPLSEVPPIEMVALWRELRSNPLQATLWQELVAYYGARSLPWQCRYASQQMGRCIKLVGGSGNALEAVSIFTDNERTPWEDYATVLIRATPWPNLHQVIDALRIQVDSEPGDWLSWLFLSRCLDVLWTGAPSATQDLKDDVKKSLARAIDCEPIAGETGYLLAQWRLRSGRPDLALSALRSVLLQAPHRYGSWLLQAEALMQLGNEEKAQESFAQAGKSQSPEFLKLLADKLWQFNFGTQSLQVREAITRLMPQDPMAWLALAEIQSRLWQMREAIQSVEQALVLQPDHAIALTLLDDLKASGNSRAQFDLELTRFESSGIRENGVGAIRLLMQSLYQSHLSAEEIADLHKRVGAAMYEQARASFASDLAVPEPLPWSPIRKLRVGYVSGDLHRQHPVNLFMLPVLERHDRTQFEVFVYQTGTLIDEYTQRARACVDHWREVTQLNDAALHRQIIEDKIDVLVDLAGHTQTHRLGVFAMRAAPIQITYLGYPHSTGMPFMDWIIADEVVAPKTDEHHFTEKVARVTGSVFCWHPVDDYPLPRDSGMAKSGDIVFGSFNNLLKVDDATVDVWARLMRECPESKLLLKSAVLADPVIAEQTVSRFESRGVAKDRLILRGPSELSVMMQEYLDVDVALDPFPYNGGTTSVQALWMGCPMISLEGHNFVSRMGASFLTQLGRPEWLAQTEDEYVQKAISLAAEIREKPWSRHALRELMARSGVCDISRQTRDIESIYREACGVQCGLAMDISREQ